MDSKKLLNKQELCITDIPSACIVACPFRLAIREFIGEIQKENFDKACELLSNKIPFYNIICRICDHPCEDMCVLKDKGEPIAISELEKFVIKVGRVKKKKNLPIPKKNKSVAVIGGGMSGLTAAVELSRKGYEVTIYEKENQLGGRIWTVSERILPRQIIQEELSVIDNMDISIKLKKVIESNIKLKKILEKYNAVFLSTGKWKDSISVNSNTFSTDIEGVFAGGSLIEKNRDSIMLSAFNGKKAAGIIDRYVKGISLVEKEDENKSFYTPAKITETSSRTVSSNEAGFNKEEAISEAKRCMLCKCDECYNACAHMRKFNIKPLRYIRSINHNNNIVLGDHYANKMINSCTLCGLCGETCPSGLNMGEIIRETRESMVDRGKMPPSAHDFALRDMEFNNSEYFRFLRNQPGFEKSEYIFFPGCQLSASAPEYVEKVYSYLTENLQNGVGLMLGCCGAPAEWAGRREMFESSIKETLSLLNKMGNPKLILACSTCFEIFKKYMPEINIISLWEIICEKGIPTNNRIGEGKSITIHDACSTRHETKIHESVRKIIKQLGCEVEELKYSKEKTKCCGYGGLVYYANREQAEDFIKERISENSKDYVSYCFMCRDLFASKGKRTLHVLDLIYGNDLEMLAEKKGPTFSERHDNRRRLKNKLRRDIWGEKMSEENNIMEFKINYSEKTKNKMEEKLILNEDIEKVIDYAENTGCKFLNSENNHYLAKKKNVNVTYWVEYEKKEEEFIIHNIYSHRMELVEEDL